MGEWAQRWWPTIVNSQRAPSTISGYEGALRLYVLPHLGDRSLRSLRRIDFEEWLGELRHAGYSNSTIHGARTVAGMIITSALDARIVASNPLAGLRLPMTSSKTRHALNVDQVEAIAESVDPWWRTYVLVLAYCGLRPGEAVALQRRDLDDLGRLTVERGISEHRGRLNEQDTKTHRARIVQVPTSVLRELREHLGAHVGPDPESPIFTTPARTLVRMSNSCHKAWEPVSARARPAPVGPLPTCFDTQLRAAWPSKAFLSLPLPPHWAMIRRSSFARTATCTPGIWVASPTRWTSHVQSARRSDPVQ